MSGNQGLFVVKNEIGIVNFALSQLSIDPIPSFNEDSKICDEMRRDFQLAKDSILRSYVFDWAHRAEKLIPYADDKGGYHKPSDYVNFIGLGTDCAFCCCSEQWRNLTVYSHKASVREVNSRLYIQSCCCDKFEWLHYSWNNQNYSDMPYDLFEAIAYKLAYISSMRLSKNIQLTEFARQRTADILEQAKRFAGMENKQLEGVKTMAYPLRPGCGGFY